jgi:hypothetical protein
VTHMETVDSDIIVLDEQPDMFYLNLNAGCV